MQPPDRWESYQPLGKVIPGTRLIPFKVPLKKELCGKLPIHQQFSPRSLISMVRETGYRLGMVVDLTFTRKYYSPSEFQNQGIRYEKIFMKGHDIPGDDVVYRFFDVLESFYNSNSDEKQIVGVHCTHGINRTGYVVCRYMIERLGFEPEKAINHLTTGNPVYLFRLRAHGGSDLSAEDAYSSMAPDPAFAFVGVYNEARGYPIERDNLLEDLRARKVNKE